MIGRKQVAAVAAGAGLAAGLVAEHALVRRRRTLDPERDERFGERRGVRARMLERPDGARLFVEEAGPRARRGAVFVHASAMRTDVWHYQLAGLGGHRLVFYDLRGHGRSQPKGDAGFSIPLLADDLVAVVEDCGLDEVVLVGHSVGGMVALELCARRPDLARDVVAGLVLVNTTYCPAVETVAGGAALTRLERVTRRPLDALGGQSHRIDRLRRIVRPSDAVFWAVAFLAFGPGASAKQIDFTYDMLAETPSDVILDLLRSYRDFDVTDALTSIRAPALVIGGTHDKLTMAHASEHLAENLPDARLEMLDGCGHMTMLERHDEFDRLVGGWLDERIGRPRRAARRASEEMTGT